MKKALVIEDQRAMRRVLCFYLSGYYEVDTAVNGQTGHEKLMTGKYDIIISDINMPEMDGITMLKVASRENILNGAKFFFSTTEVLSETEKAFLTKLGLTGCIKKPYNKEHLLQIIEGF